MLEIVTPSRFRSLAGWILLLSLPALLLHGVVSRAAALYPLGDGANPWFLPQHALLLYLLVPFAAVSAGILFLAPGLFLALAWGRAATVASWITTAAGISLVLVSLTAGVATRLAGPIVGAGFGLLTVSLTAAAALVAGWRVRQTALPWPASDAAGRLTLWLSALVPILLCLALAPKFLWENFNGDGVHAFESSRLLLRQAFPFWPESAVTVARFPGLTSMLFAYPNAWYLRLFGEVEAAVRFPLLLHLAVLCAAIVAVAEHGRARLAPAGILAIWGSLLAFVVTLAFSATYSPYHADLALPAAQDALLLLCLLGWAHAYMRRDWIGMALFAALTYVSLPSGLLLIAFWLLGDLLLSRPRPWGSFLRGSAMLAACVAAGALALRLLGAFGVPLPWDEYGGAGMLQYFAFLRLTDWTRVGFILVPCGIFPLVQLLRWKRQDAIARTLTLVTAAYFAFFFVQAYISLHHFVPAMVLPIVVAARLLPEASRPARSYSLAWQGAAALALLLSLPRSFALQAQDRRVGETISETVGDYRRSDPEVFRAAALLSALFPVGREPAVPDSSFGGSLLVWLHYARHGRLEEGSNYLLTRQDRPAPAGMRLVAADSAAAVYVRSDSIWQAHLAWRPKAPPGSPLYSIPRDRLFRIGRGDGGGVIDVAAQLERWGIPVQSILARLRSKR